jgi:hypothetical protein
MVNVKSMPYPFPELEIRRPCTVVGGTNLSAKALVRLVTGRNLSGSELDRIPANDYFNDYVVAAALDNYPTASEDGVDSAFNLQPFLGILETATVDDGQGFVTFRGLVKGLTCTIRSSGSATDELFPANSIVFLDASNSYAITVAGPTTAAGNTLETALDDIIVGRTAETYTSTDNSETTASFDVFWDGVSLSKFLQA